MRQSVAKFRECVRARFARIAVLVCIAADGAAGHVSFHFGIEAGVPLTDTLVSTSESSPSQSFDYSLFNRFNSETKRLLIGPTLRFETQSGLGFEVDALYQRVDSDFSAVLVQATAPTQQIFQQTAAHRWQFPVLIQYARSLRKLRWFVGAGPSLSHIDQPRPKIMGDFLLGSVPSNGSVPSSATWGGITAGGGVDVRVSRLHLRPEFRYSHWFAGSSAITPFSLIATRIPGQFGQFVSGASSAGSLGVPIGFFFPIHQNEASFLLGVTF